MKLDGEQVLCHGAVDNKPSSKPFGYNKIAVDSVGLESGNVTVNEDQNEEAFYDFKAKECDADQLQYPVHDVSKVDSYTRVDDSTHEDEKEVRDFVAPAPLTHSSLKIDSFNKDSVFFIDKNVMEPDLPELVVCYKENTYHVVKDICVDEGVPLQDKFLFHTGVDEKKLCTFLIPEDIKSEVEKERVDLDTSTTYLSENDLSNKRDSKESMPIGGIGFGGKEEITNDMSEGTFSLGELLSMSKAGVELSQSKSSLKSIDEVEHLSIPKSNENPISEVATACEESQNGGETLSVTPTVESVAEESNHKEAMLGTLIPDNAAEALDRCHDQTILSCPPNSVTEESKNDAEEEKLPRTNLDCVAESTNTSDDKLSCNSLVETKITTLDFNPSTATASREGDGSPNGGSKHFETRSSTRPEDASTGPFSGQLHYSHGESSFSSAVPISGLISYSGPIAYSGSLSHRSDSSTTSARSFAFPVLQSEWNSSPVRMAKADRRHFRKHRSWTQGLLCCRF